MAASLLNSADIQSLRQQIIYAKNTSHSLNLEISRRVKEEEGYLLENARDFASLLLRILEGLELNIDLQYERDLKELQESGVEEIRRLRQRVVETIQISAELTDLLKYIDGARAIENSWGIVGEVDRFCRSLHKRARVIPYPRWEYNYRYYPITYKLLRISELANAQDSRINAAMTQLLVDSPYYFSLQFPPTNKPNLLQMAMWGHELGHFIDNIEGMAVFNLENTFESQIAYFSRQRANEIVQNTIPLEIVRDLINETQSPEESQIVEVLQKYNQRIGELIFRWAREIFADLYSVHLFGPASIFSFVEFVQPLSQGKTNHIDSAYPPFDIRLSIMLKEYKWWLSQDLVAAQPLDDLLGENGPLRIMTAEINRLAERLPESPNIFVQEIKLDDEIDVIYPYMMKILEIVVDDFRAYISDLKRNNPEAYMTPSDLIIVSQWVEDLQNGIPPVLSTNNFGRASNLNLSVRFFPLIINSGWLSWLKVQSQAIETPFMQIEFEKLNGLLLKAVEENVAIHWFTENSRFTETDPLEREKADRSMMQSIMDHPTDIINYTGALNKTDMLSELAKGTLIIRPLLSPTSQIHDASVDLRLGNEFTVLKRAALTMQDPVQHSKDSSMMEHENKYFITFGKPFVLHPWQFLSVNCLEFVKIPSSCIGLITNRKWGARLGLAYIGTRGLEPGFAGQITLEIANFGNAPVLLYPGSRICSLYLTPLHH